LRGRGARGFTLVELLVVVAIIGIAAAAVTLAIRDPSATRLEHEAARLATLLDIARAEARASGLPVAWAPVSDEGMRAQGGNFRFVGLPASIHLPRNWLEPEVRAEVIGARSVTLGPEPMIGAQRIALRLNDQRIVLATDGLGSFAIADDAGAPERP
jgi:general secretion pathway protein H